MSAIILRIYFVFENPSLMKIHVVTCYVGSFSVLLICYSDVRELVEHMKA